MKNRIYTLALAALLLAGCSALFQQSETITQHPDGTTTTNLTTTVSPGTAATLETAKDIAEAIPSPWSQVAAGALGILSAVLAEVARRKTRKAALVAPIVEAIEAAGKNPDLAEPTGRLKSRIQRNALAAGVEKDLSRTVQQLTKSQ